MAHQSAEAPFERCAGEGRVLARIIGSRARADEGRQQSDMTQRAKVGYFPCCTRPTHVAAPSYYVVG